MPMMKCGCAAMATCSSRAGVDYDPPIPACIIHECYEVVEAPDLSGRTAKCSYYGRLKPRHRYANDECNYGCQGNISCKCGTVPSSMGLAFFSHHPDKPQDKFYCGCFGWD